MTICDDIDDKKGGCYGVRKGHAKALLALDEGNIEGISLQKIVVRGKSGCGFATIDKNVIVAVVESFLEIN